ncbi:MAG: site-2 protease family protein, partial [Thermoanaerobaculia bacterium]|nr:site-2 protease family protein [Thermoanaerobaculia bacterium]
MRRWSWKLGEFAGIGVYVHATFLLLVGWLALRHYMAGDTLAATVSGILFVLAIFACVILHEYGHALTARRYGVTTRDIILLPIGGVARLERIPDEPRQELAVAIAGPAVNVVIAVVLYGWLRATGTMVPLEEIAVTEGPFLERLMLVNVILVL